ncbi:MAG: transglutaminase domain-containing protein [Lachnospiraceae bacterium]|nr:peptidase [Lachnospiraceae bacterium]
MEPYYYNHMNKQQQAVYHAMKTGIQSLAPSFPCPRMEGKELTDVFLKLRLDCPEIFFVSGFHFRYYPDSANVELSPEYLFDKNKIKDHQKAMKARVEKLVRPAVTMAELEKEQYVHDFICQNVRYDKLKKSYSHEILGPLGQGVGVCEGIAKTVKILCDQLGIWCIVVISEANPEKNIKYRHAWNIVKIGGTYYHLDATFDNTLSHMGPVRYDYFNLDDGKVFRDHEPVIWKVPACTVSDGFYYRVKKLSFTKMEEVEKRALQAAKKGKELIFHWRGGALNRETAAQMLKAFKEAGEKKGKYPRAAINWPQAVLLVEYLSELPAEELVTEEANEGEQQM